MIDTTHSLTPSERDVLFYTALGLYAREIAPIRGTSHNVIQNQRGSAILKLGVYSSIEDVHRSGIPQKGQESRLERMSQAGWQKRERATDGDVNR